MDETTKYSIRQRLLRLPGNFQENRYRLCIALKINDKTLLRWMAVKKNEFFSIPSDQFYIIANFFGCLPDELINHEQKAVHQ